MLKRVTGKSIRFGCGGPSKTNKYFMQMNFDYDQNFNSRGGDYISFEIKKFNIDESLKRGLWIYHLNSAGEVESSTDPTLSRSNCGDPVTSAKLSPIKGSNWHGWILEEAYSKHRGKCNVQKEYTSRYRCVSVMVGNQKITAQTNTFCLLRKKECSL